MSKITVNRNVNYTNIDNTILQSKTLSFKAKGLFAYMWSLPNDWDYSINGLYSCSKDGRDSIRSAINELETAGYLVRKKIRTGNGKFQSNEYTLIDIPNASSSQQSPLTENPLTENPLTENPTMEKPLTENPRQQSNKKQNNKKEINNKQNNKEKKEDIVFFPDDSELNSAFKDFVEFRRLKKSPLTDRAIELCIKKLDTIGSTNAERIEIINTSIERGWTGLFALKKTTFENQNVNPFDEMLKKIQSEAVGQ